MSRSDREPPHDPTVPTRWILLFLAVAVGALALTVALLGGP